jgi:hypothetical protein
MKAIFFIPFLAILALPTFAEEVTDNARSATEKHTAGSEKLADEQDELSADVQQLVIEQTIPDVIKLLGEVEGIMDETTDYLADSSTDGKTIAAQTEIIEKIHAAAKAKQQQGESGEAGSAMMDMMERMMGKKEGEGEGKDGKQPGPKPGQGQTGDSDSGNAADGGGTSGATAERTVPKAGGKAGKSLPREFQDALDAYNRGLEEVSK